MCTIPGIGLRSLVLHLILHAIHLTATTGLIHFSQGSTVEEAAPDIPQIAGMVRPALGPFQLHRGA